MSRPVKELLRKEVASRLEGVSSMAVVGFTGLDAIQTNQIRGRLREKGMRMMVVKNSVARQAFDELDMPEARRMIDGPCAVVHGADNVVEIVRELLDIGKEAPALTVKAALLEGEVYGEERIEELSKYPTRDEAIAELVALALSPARNLAAALIGPGANIAGILKTIEENSGEGDSSAEAAEG